MAIIYAGKWTKPTITYCFTNEINTPGFTQADAEAEFQSACDAWAVPTGLKFQKGSDPATADIPITWTKIDQSGDFLAKVTAKPNGSNNQIPMEFDTSEEWTKNNLVLTAANFKAVALHELGHVLGLGHSADSNAVMYPLLTPFVPRTELSNDDKDGAKYLYQNLWSSGIVIFNETDVNVSWFAFNGYDVGKFIALKSGDLAPNELQQYEPPTNETGRYFIRFTQVGGGTELAGCTVENGNLLNFFAAGSGGYQVEVAK